MGSLSTLLITSAAAGVASHVAYFRTAEFDAQPLPVVVGFMSSLGALALLVGPKVTLIVSTSFFAALFASIVVYRFFFHPLNGFPGPPGARLSKFWTVKQVVNSHHRLFKVIQEAGQQYGTYVRTGPREISVFDADAVAPLLASSKKTSKAPLYGAGETTLHMNNDKAFHKKHRKVWDVAMKESLSDFEPRVEDFTSQLLARIKRNEGTPVLMNDYSMFYSYDVMSALAFGSEIGFVKGDAKADAKEVIQSIVEGIEAMGLLLHIPWVLSLLTPLAPVIKPLRNWNEWTIREVDKRKKMETPKPDIMKHLIANASTDAEGEQLLFADARLIIAAGSDTTGTTLTFIFVHLATYPEQAEKLYEEIMRLEKSYSCKTAQPILDSIINETMRLFPPVTINAPRLVPAEGLTFKGTFFPAGTVLSLPLYALAHDARYFVQPDDFIPERWTTRPELILNRNAFQPFLTGPYVCAGKALAYMELRSVVTRIVKNYTVKPPAGFRLQEFYDKVADHAVITPPKQMLTFVPRVIA